MGKNELKQLQIIDITQLQQKNVGVISSNENLNLAETAHIWPFGQKFNPVGRIQTLIDYAENSHGYENSWFNYIRDQRKSSKNETP